MSRRIIDSNEAYPLEFLIALFKVKILSTLTAAIVAVAAYFITHIGFGAVYFFIIMDIVFAAIFIPNIISAGIKFTISHVIIHAIWAFLSWKLADFLCPYLINRM